MCGVFMEVDYMVATETLIAMIHRLFFIDESPQLKKAKADLSLPSTQPPAGHGQGARVL